MTNEEKQDIFNIMNSYQHGDSSALNGMYFLVENFIFKAEEKGYTEGFEAASTIALEVIDDQKK